MLAGWTLEVVTAAMRMVCRKNPVVHNLQRSLQKENVKNLISKVIITTEAFRERKDQCRVHSQIYVLICLEYN